MWGREWRRAFRLDVGKHHVDRDVDDELAFHIEMRTRKLMAKGLTREAAFAQALQQFGDLRAVRSECLTIDQQRERAIRWTRFIEQCRLDVMYALRTLRRQPGFTIVVLLILALGIGANTAIFSLVDALLLRTLPVPHPEQLVAIGDPTAVNRLNTGTPKTDIFSYPLYRDLRDGNHLVSGLLATGPAPSLDVVIRDSSAGANGAGAEHPRGRFVSDNFFHVLDVSAFLGRTFIAHADPVPGSEPVVVLSYGYWERRFARDHGIVGQTILVNNVPLTVVGVTPPDFSGVIVGRPTDLWIPLTMEQALLPHGARLAARDVSWLLLMGRLAPGVTLEHARTGFTQLARRSLEIHAAEAGARVADARAALVEVTSGARGFSAMRADYRTPVLILMAAVALVLLIVCANVANLMFARGTSRQREISVRMALGAGRMRVVRQLLTESVMLAASGAVLGVLLASFAIKLLLHWIAPGANTIPLDVHMDARVIIFTALLAVMTAVLCGLFPAVRVVHVELSAVLRSQARGVMGGVRGTPGRIGLLGQSLVVLQVALSLVLLVGTAMLVRSMRNLDHTDTGLARDQLLVVDLNPQASGYTGERLGTLARQLLERVGRLPGVRAVTLSLDGLFSAGDSETRLRVPGFTPRTDDDLRVPYDAVGPDYFRAIGARLLRGRDIEPQDGEDGARVMVVNQAFADFYFPNESAIGRTVIQGEDAFRIVGIVADVKDHDLRRPPARRLYVPFFRFAGDSSGWIAPVNLTLEVRASGDPAVLTLPVRRAVRDLDASLIPNIDPLNVRMSRSIGDLRLISRVISGLGTVALMLAAVGLFGIMTYTTVRRTGEFGLRRALGAEPRDVTRLVLREAMLLVTGGVLIGVPSALLAARLLDGQLFGIGLLDLPSIALAVGVLGASAVLAAYLPARHASRVAPLVALREE
jgi:predicted permease